MEIIEIAKKEEAFAIFKSKSIRNFTFPYNLSYNHKFQSKTTALETLVCFSLRTPCWMYYCYLVTRHVNVNLSSDLLLFCFVLGYQIW